MKLMNINITKFSFLATLLVLLVLAGCKEPEETIGLPPTEDLNTLIAEAQNLIDTSVEGISPGDYKPGSVQQLQDVLTWVDWQLANATDQTEIDKAAIRLQKYIDIFKASIVQLAIPIFNASAGSHIQISDNVKAVLSETFTIELGAYYLGSTGWVENIFSMESADVSGLTLRYYLGNLDLVVANGDWTVGSAAGAFKVGEWVHYAITSDGTNYKVYMDGVEIINLDAPGRVFNDKPFLLGNGPEWTDRVYNGMLTDFRVWSTIRTADELIANKDVALEGTEEGLEVYFPMDADLGTFFTDKTGNYSATFVGTGVAWAPGGVPPEIILDYTALDAAIADAEALKASVVEGVNDGDYPIGTKDYLQTLIDAAVATKSTAEKQDEVDAAQSSLEATLSIVESTLVADADGVYIDRENPDAKGLRISPNFTPTTDYTIEFDINLKTLMLESGDNGEIFCNGSIGLRYFGYNEASEESILNSGGLWNFNNIEGAWAGPTAPALTMKSGVWQHVAIIHKQADSTIVIYVDGVDIVTQTGVSTPLVAGDDGIWVGTYWSKMNGSIKDWRMWDIARDPADLNADITGSEANLQMYFPLDKVAGVGFKDVTGNYNAELQGIEWNK